MVTLKCEINTLTVTLRRILGLACQRHTISVWVFTHIVSAFWNAPSSKIHKITISFSIPIVLQLSCPSESFPDLFG